jgi:putative transposase
VTAAREAHGISERRACSIIGVDRSAMRYRHRRPEDASTRLRLKELAAERRRFGWRRLKLLLEREGIHMNHKKLWRLYAEERLQVRHRGGRKRALGTRAPMALLQGPNQRWSLDFAADTLTDGRRFRMLVVVDDFTRECLGLVADTSLSGARVARELTAIIALRGARPQLCVSDNGTELTSMAILAWCQDSKVGWHYIAPAAYWFRYGGWMLNALPVRSHCIARDNAEREAREAGACNTARAHSSYAESAREIRETEYAIPPSFPMRSFCDMCPH